MADEVLLTSEQVAARLSVTVESVYKLRTEDEKFPAPTRYSGRSPLYAAAAIDAFVKQRSKREPSARGRRPRLVTSDAVDRSQFPERLRESIASGAGGDSLTTQADLIAELGLNTVTFGQRMRGRTRWKDSELTHIAEKLGVDTTDANAVVDAARSRRKSD
ncbi:helix-turn-helix transcriptional regulator [Microbacterium testaceum]|uniref:helix-turn-helix transcriptional regulator n=1 Tax=Microbacterium testaceum TaxID=2033 RepID=UPI002AC761CF|nr:DNA-binding protein [Microbacterium testaceum]MDZ5146317.1 DNA-binding protein [Microbacterium testaceum]